MYISPSSFFIPATLSRARPITGRTLGTMVALSPWGSRPLGDPEFRSSSTSELPLGLRLIPCPANSGSPIKLPNRSPKAQERLRSGTSSSVLRSVPSLTLGFGFKQFSFDHRKQVSPGVSLHAFEIPQALMPCCFSFTLSDSADGSTIGLGSLLKGIDLGALATAPAAFSSDTTSR